MEEKMIRFDDFLRNKKESMEKEAISCIKDDRKDEGILLKAKANIYDIFGTMFQVACKKHKDKDNIAEEFLQKTKSIPNNWKISYEKAKEFGDIDKMMMEETKLTVVEDIVATFEVIWRD